VRKPRNQLEDGVDGRREHDRRRTRQAREVVAAIQAVDNRARESPLERQSHGPADQPVTNNRQPLVHILPSLHALFEPPCFEPAVL
jgi:hypothetical protein